jgi:hypothetical protein
MFQWCLAGDSDASPVSSTPVRGWDIFIFEAVGVLPVFVLLAGLSDTDEKPKD